MIGPLGGGCWHFDCGVWEEPHFTSEAAAVAEEAETARVEERAPRPVLRRAVPCWVAVCDRCERPLGEEDTGWEHVHAEGEQQLGTALAGAGWVVGAGLRVLCPDCGMLPGTGGQTERAPVTVCAADGSTRTVLAERTACPELVLTPRRGERGVWLGVELIHLPTGRYIPTVDGDTVGVLHRVAELLADLDWSCPDPGCYATGYPDRVRAASRQACREHQEQPCAERGDTR